MPPKTITLLWFCGSVRGTLVLIVFLHFLALFNKEFAVSGLVVVFNFQSFSWLWVLWLSNQLGHQLKGDAFEQVGHQLKGECF